MARRRRWPTSEESTAASDRYVNRMLERWEQLDADGYPPDVAATLVHESLANEDTLERMWREGDRGDRAS